MFSGMVGACGVALLSSLPAIAEVQDGPSAIFAIMSVRGPRPTVFPLPLLRTTDANDVSLCTPSLPRRATVWV